jgi:hypothetical protein
MQSKLTRRRMLQDSARLALGSTFLMSSPFSIFGNSQEKKSRVVLIRDEALLDSAGNLNQQVLSHLLDEGLVKLTQAGSPAEAWKKVIRPGDVVGVKSNRWNELRTPPELESILKSRVLDAGIRESDISVNDRGVLNDPVFKRSTALINVRPSRAHAWSGVGSMLKNYIMFTPRPSSYHDDSCADLAKLWELPEVKGKTRLNILVMITPLFHIVGSNYFNKEYTWPYKGLILGFDPVAVDSVGLQIIQARRKEYFKEDRPLNPPAKHINLADTRHHLGTADFSKIELVKAGWQEAMLI